MNAILNLLHSYKIYTISRFTANNPVSLHSNMCLIFIIVRVTFKDKSENRNQEYKLTVENLNCFSSQRV